MCTSRLFAKHTDAQSARARARYNLRLTFYDILQRKYISQRMRTEVDSKIG